MSCASAITTWYKKKRWVYNFLCHPLWSLGTFASPSSLTCSILERSPSYMHMKLLKIFFKKTYFLRFFNFRQFFFRLVFFDFTTFGQNRYLTRVEALWSLAGHLGCIWDSVWSQTQRSNFLMVERHRAWPTSILPSGHKKPQGAATRNATI